MLMLVNSRAMFPGQKVKLIIQGGPERMHHLRSLLSKKPWTKSNYMSALMYRTFFFLQNYINVNDFDEGVLILEPFF